MNPWENFINLLGWGLLALTVIVMGFILYIIIMVAWGLLKKAFSRKQ
jgi:5-bromo-4-chloroindolyl phosphate hydrolysis protein